MSENDKPAGNPQLNLRLPAEVGVKLSRDAKKSKTTIQAVILSIIASHYGVEVAAPRRGQPKKATE